MRLPFGVLRRGEREGHRGARLLAALLVVAATLAFLPAAGHSYPCITRVRDSQTDERCRPQQHPTKTGRHSSFLELALAGGIFVVLLLVPVVPKNLEVWEERRSHRDHF